MTDYNEVLDAVEGILKNTNIPEGQKSIVAEHISQELIRKIDFYTRKFYLIMTQDGSFVRYCVSSSGTRDVYAEMAASSATVFDDMVSCNDVLLKCKRKYPSEVFLVKSFEY